MPSYVENVVFNERERADIAEVVRVITVAFPEAVPGSLRDRERLHPGVRYLNMIANHPGDPVTRDKVEAALEAAREQLAACERESKPEFWQAQETPGVPLEISAQYGERAMGFVLADARKGQAIAARKVVDLLREVAHRLDPESSYHCSDHP